MTDEKIDVLLAPYMQRYNPANEYSLLPDANGNSQPTSMPFLHNVYDGVMTHDSHAVVPKNELEKYSPDQLNVQAFWQRLHQNYKYIPICGRPVKSVAELNNITFNDAKWNGTITEIDIALRNLAVPQPKMLEIGFGYGNIATYVTTNHKHAEYYGIDLLKRFDALPNLFETDGYTIPDEVPYDLDIVVAHNIFQHLTQSQRLNYYELAYKRLKIGGKLVFDNFIATTANLSDYSWGWLDETGRPYIQFFTQLTPVDYEDELRDMLDGVGFEITKFNVDHHMIFCVATKK